MSELEAEGGLPDWIVATLMLIFLIGAGIVLYLDIDLLGTF
ncbi:hypothetical protein [Halorientalis marina]|nr:hypothetical protein [Halorientalis marina]